MEAIEMTEHPETEGKKQKNKTLMAQSWVPPPRTVSVLSTGDRLPC